MVDAQEGERWRRKIKVWLVRSKIYMRKQSSGVNLFKLVSGSICYMMCNMSDG